MQYVYNKRIKKGPFFRKTSKEAGTFFANLELYCSALTEIIFSVLPKATIQDGKNPIHSFGIFP